MSVKSGIDFFILGYPRSGTSLLRLILTSHSKIHIPPEASFATWLVNKNKNTSPDIQLSRKERYDLVEDIESSRKFEFWDISKHNLEKIVKNEKYATYQDLITSIYQFHAHKNNKKAAFIGDKNNVNLNEIINISRFFPASYFLLLLRDPRDIYVSYLKLSKVHSKSRYFPKLPRDISDFTVKYVETMNNFMYNLEKIQNNFCLVNYEKLVMNPDLELSSFLSKFNLTWESDQNLFNINNLILNLEPREFDDWKNSNLHELNSRSVGSYKSYLSEEQLDLLEDAQIIYEKLMRLREKID